MTARIRARFGRTRAGGRGIAAVVLVCGSVLAGCGVSGGGMADSEDNAKVVAEVMRRPSIETMVAKYERMYAALLRRLEGEAGLAPFNERTESGDYGGGCGSAFPGVDSYAADQRSLNRWTSPTALTPQTWPKALRVASEVARQYGFGEPTIVADQPDNHQASLGDEFGGQLVFGSINNTILVVYTSCHPYEEKATNPPNSSSGR